MVRVVLGAIHATMTVDMTADTTVGTTEAAMIAMTTGTTTDHTGNYLHLFSPADDKLDMFSKLAVFLYVMPSEVNCVCFQEALPVPVLQRGLQVSVQIAVLFSP